MRVSTGSEGSLFCAGKIFGDSHPQRQGGIEQEPAGDDAPEPEVAGMNLGHLVLGLMV